MNKFQFVGAVRAFVRDSAIEGTMKNLFNPPGRGYKRRVEARTHWIQSLDAGQRRYLDEVVALSVHAAVFSFLAVLEGTYEIETQPGCLKLIHESPDGEVVLSDPSGDTLTSIYNSDIHF